eukprot:scaffold19271_cov28-Tisochrysis_lutea.AAC.10
MVIGGWTKPGPPARLRADHGWPHMHPVEMASEGRHGNDTGGIRQDPCANLVTHLRDLIRAPAHEHRKQMERPSVRASSTIDLPRSMRRLGKQVN